MIRIEIPKLENLPALTAVAKETFIQSHGHSASQADVAAYLHANYTEAAFEDELNDPQSIYRLLFYQDRLVGYSKLLFNQAIPAIDSQQIAKLERIYVLAEFHGTGLGAELFNYNSKLAKDNDQQGIWLFTWVENKRAIGFYEKVGFKIVGSHDFRLSATHTNPNHQMYLAF